MSNHQRKTERGGKSSREKEEAEGEERGRGGGGKERRERGREGEEEVEEWKCQGGKEKGREKKY